MAADLVTNIEDLEKAVTDLEERSASLAEEIRIGSDRKVEEDMKEVLKEQIQFAKQMKQQNDLELAKTKARLMILQDYNIKQLAERMADVESAATKK